MKKKKFQKNMMKFAMELKSKTKQLMLVKKLNMAKIYKKLGLNPMITSYWINP